MKEPETLCLAVIQQVVVPSAHMVLPVPYYLRTGSPHPVDIKSIQCMVSCVKDQERWGLIDHSGPLAHAVFTEVD